MYTALETFYDLQDCVVTKTARVYHKYEKGDIFPRSGVRVSEARIAELAGSGNRMGRPLIGELEVPENGPAEMPSEETEKEPEEVPAEEEKKAPEGKSKATEGRRKKS